jgi:hypothetical protein
VSPTSAPAPVEDANLAASSGLAAHGVCWRLSPFSERLGSRGLVEVGYQLVLAARFHPAGPSEIEAGVRALHERLRELALEVVGPAPRELLLSVLPMGRGTVVAEERLAIEVELVVFGSLAHPDKLPVPAATRRRIDELGRSMRALGLPSRGEFATTPRFD